MRPAPSRVAIVAAVVLLLAIIVAVAAAGTSRIACASCHGQLSEAAASRKHADVSCLACHAPAVSDKVAFVWAQWTRMLPGRLAGRGISGPVTETRRGACLSCHSDVYSAVVGSNLGLRIKHSSCAPDASCDECHSAVAHGARTRWIRQPVMERCTACHLRRGASIQCDTCHAGKYQRERLASGPWQVTHGKGWRTAHGMGNLESCATCHPRDYCATCHGVAIPHDLAFGKEHGVLAQAPGAGCAVCHKSRDFCTACHGVPMPHPAGFLKVHSKAAGTVDNPACERCHDRPDCVACHIRHVHPGGAAGPKAVPPGGAIR